MNTAIAYETGNRMERATDRLSSLQDRLERQNSVLETAAKRLSQVYSREQSAKQRVAAHQADLEFLNNELVNIVNTYKDMRANSADNQSIVNIVNAYHEVVGARKRVGRELKDAHKTYLTISSALKHARTLTASAQEDVTSIENQIENYNTQKQILTSQADYARDVTLRMKKLTSDYMGGFSQVDMLDSMLTYTREEYQSAVSQFNQAIGDMDVQAVNKAEQLIDELTLTYNTLKDQKNNVVRTMHMQYERIKDTQRELETARANLSTNELVDEIYVKDGMMVGVRYEGNKVERFDQPKKDTKVPYLRVV